MPNKVVLVETGKWIRGVGAGVDHTTPPFIGAKGCGICPTGEHDILGFICKSFGVPIGNPSSGRLRCYYQGRTYTNEMKFYNDRLVGSPFEQRITTINDDPDLDEESRMQLIKALGKTCKLAFKFDNRPDLD